MSVSDIAAQYLRGEPEGNAQRSYQTLFNSIAERIGVDACNHVIRRAVLSAYIGPCSEVLEAAKSSDELIALPACERLEDDYMGWRVPPAIDYLANLCEKLHVRNIITTNFDPLIEIALRKIHGKRPIVFHEGSARSFEHDHVAVIHVHGHWHKSDTRHTRYSLGKDDDSFAAWFLGRLKSSRCLVIGYSGWDDRITRCIKEAAKRGFPMDMRWAYYENPTLARSRYPDSVLCSGGLSAHERIRFHFEVDAASILRQVALNFYRTLATEKPLTPKFAKLSQREIDGVLMRRSTDILPEDEPKVAFAVASQYMLAAETGVKPKHLENLNRVYPYSINRYLKSVVNSGGNFAAKLTNGALGVLRAVPVSNESLRHAGIHASYMLGRCGYAQNSIVTPKLIEVKKELSAAIIERSDKRADELSSLRELRFWRRTCLISLAHLGHSESAGEYLDQILEDDEEDSINRGFHLEYYGDTPFDGASPLSSKDTLKNARITRDTLARDVVDWIDNPAESTALIEIVLATLASIEHHRVGKGEHEKKIIPLFDAVLASPNSLSPRLQRYLKLVVEGMRFGQDFGFRELGRLATIKFVPRTGWVRRGILFPETVGAHTFGTMILAHLVRHAQSGFSLDRVHQLLFVHDLAESVTGDVIKREQTSSSEDREREIVERFAWAGGFLSPPATLRWFIRAFREFVERSSVEAKIAHDLDKLDLVLTGHCYLATKGAFERESVRSMLEKVSREIQTEQVRSVLRYIEKMAEHGVGETGQVPDWGGTLYFGS